MSSDAPTSASSAGSAPFNLNVGQAILFAGMSFDVYTDPRPQQAIWEVEVPSPSSSSSSGGATWLGYMSPLHLARCRKGVLELSIDSVDLKGAGLMKFLRSTPACYIRITSDPNTTTTTRPGSVGGASAAAGRCVWNRTSTRGGFMRRGASWSDERMYFYVDEGDLASPADGDQSDCAMPLRVSIRVPMALSPGAPILSALDLLRTEDPSGESDAYSTLAEGAIEVAFGPHRTEHSLKLPILGDAANGAVLNARARFLPMEPLRDGGTLFGVSPMGLGAARMLDVRGGGNSAGLKRSAPKGLDAAMETIVRSVYVGIAGSQMSLDEISTLVSGSDNAFEKLIDGLDLDSRTDGELLSLCRARGLARIDDFEFRYGARGDLSPNEGNREKLTSLLKSALLHDVETGWQWLLDRTVEDAARNYNSFSESIGADDKVDGRSIQKNVNDFIAGLKRLSGGLPGARPGGDVLLDAVSEALTTAMKLGGETAGGAGGADADAVLRTVRSATARAIAAYNIKLSSHRAGRTLTSVDEGSAWQALVSANNLIGGSGSEVDPLAYERVAFVDNVITDTQCIIWKEKAPRVADSGERRCKVVVVFRGTETAKWKDILTDLNMAPTRLLLSEDGSDDDEDDDGGKKKTVHSGFLDAYRSVRANIMRVMRDITNGEDDVQWEVCTTGHSLGGALATLFAYDCGRQRRRRQRRGVPVPARAASIDCYTFGCPRVGSAAFAIEFSALVDESWRFFNRKDVVATAPRTMYGYDYRHVRGGVLLCADSSTMRVGRESRFESEGAAGMEEDGGGEEADAMMVPEGVMDLRKMGAFARGAPLGSISTSAVQQTLSELVSGDAVAQHMEDNYFDVISSVLLRVTKDDADALR